MFPNDNMGVALAKFYATPHGAEMLNRGLKKNYEDLQKRVAAGNGYIEKAEREEPWDKDDAPRPHARRAQPRDTSQDDDDGESVADKIAHLMKEKKYDVRSGRDRCSSRREDAQRHVLRCAVSGVAWTNKQIATLRDMAARGHRAREIAAALGRSIEAIRSRAADEAAPLRRPKPSYSDEDIATIKRMALARYPRQIGGSQAYIRTYADETGTSGDFSIRTENGRISAISSPVRRDRLVEKQITGGKSGRHYSISFWPSI
jgi:hypothetical protein